MHITHISLPVAPPVLYSFGGAIQRRIWEIARHQVRRGHQVKIYSIGDETRLRVEEGVEIQYIHCRTSSMLGALEYQARLQRYFRRAPSDVYHFHSHPEGSVPRPSGGGRMLLSYDNFYFRRGRSTPLFHVYRRLLRRFDELLPCSQYCLEESAAYWKLPAERMEVLFNGVNTEQFRPDSDAQARERALLGLSGRVVVYMGRVNEQKGTHVLLEAFQYLRKQMDDVHLVIAGPIGQFGAREADDGWPERMRQAGAIYLGAVAEERVAAIYNLADVFVMPTIAVEMFGMAAVEAQACGKPVVASDHAGLRETVPESCGARFPTGDAEACAAALLRLLRNDETRRAAAANALRNAAQYDWRNICDRLDLLYGMPAEERSPASGVSSGD